MRTLSWKEFITNPADANASSDPSSGRLLRPTCSVVTLHWTRYGPDKHGDYAFVSLRWHWSTVLVNWSIFRTWLMCFLLLPLTHVCGGMSECQKTNNFSFEMSIKPENDKKMLQNGATCWNLGDCFCGILACGWTKGFGAVNRMCTSAESNLLPW